MIKTNRCTTGCLVIFLATARVKHEERREKRKESDLSFHQICNQSQVSQKLYELISRF